MQLPVPISLKKWHSWLKKLPDRVESAGDEFGELSDLLLNDRVRIEAGGITDVDEIASLLLPHDAGIEQWRDSLPLSWIPQTLGIGAKCKNDIDYLYDEYEVWSDHWIASMWNNYHMLRIILHTDILSAILNNFSVAHLGLLQRCFEVMKAMTEGIVRSVPYHFGEPEMSELVGLEQQKQSLAGCYLLIWPLFIMGGLRTTSADLRAWAAKTLDRIAVTLGNHHAKSLAEQLRSTKSYEQSELWAYADKHGELGLESENAMGIQLDQIAVS